MKALIVDDSQFVRRILKGILLSSGKCKTVSEYDNGLDALNELKKNHENYGVVFLDWNLEGLDGIDVLKELRMAKIFIPVIMCTSVQEKEKIAEAMAIGIHDYIKKPFDAKTVVDKVIKINEKAKESEAEPKMKIEHGRILVVDDSRLIRNLLERMLTNMGLFSDIVCVEDGDVALCKFAQQSFDVILLDWEMERMQGLDVVSVIRERDPFIPIIMITSHGDTTHLIKAFDTGVSGFIAKPFSGVTLLEKIEQLLPHSFDTDISLQGQHFAQGSKCPNVIVCPFFKKLSKEKSQLNQKNRTNYCLGSKEGCARYFVSVQLGIENVPNSLFPLQWDIAKELVKQYT